MSTNYFLYTEIKINNKWYCINNKIKDIDKEKYSTEKLQYETLPLAVSWEDIKACIPSGKINEYHGYVHKNVISSYLIGEQEDIYDGISIEEYKKLSFEEQLLYDYFEWDDSQGWFKYFKIIIEHVKWQLFVLLYEDIVPLEFESIFE